MKRVRITYEGAFHHVMNRGINGEEIFSGHRTKSRFKSTLIQDDFYLKNNETKKKHKVIK